MPLNKFLINEIVNISDGNTAIVKNYYSSNNFVVLHAHSENDIGSIKPGMTITGQSSGFSKTITSWNYSNYENLNFFDNNYNDFEWDSYIDKVVVTDESLLIVPDEIYNLYPHIILSGPYANSQYQYEILDFQVTEGIIQDN